MTNFGALFIGLGLAFLGIRIDNGITNLATSIEHLK